jgi:hypothetical protein
MAHLILILSKNALQFKIHLLESNKVLILIFKKISLMKIMDF